MNILTKKRTFLKAPIFLLVALFYITFINAQSGPTVYFQEAEISLPNNIDNFSWNQTPQNSKINNGYVGWLRFNETPTQNIQDELNARGLRLLDYYPDKTYLFFFPREVSTLYLKNIGVSSIIPFELKQKLESRVRLNLIEDWAVEGNRILVTLEYFDFVNSDIVINRITQIPNLDIKENYRHHNVLTVAIPLENIPDLGSLPFVKWIELIQAPSEKEDTRGRGLHRASNLDTQTSAGRNYTGSGVGVLVRDDGVVGPHIDFQGRINNSATSTTGQTHGDGVAGILAGAGNLNPKNRGMAAGADIFVSNYSPSFLDNATIDLINNGQVQITNSSYGAGCNGGYTSVSREVDNQTVNTPSLLHVFSAGNSGTSNCGYGAGNGWGNITGGHKQGKNVIATANTFFEGSLANSSSRGPATDGRIKPDITAHGQNQISTDENNSYLTFGGTSGAAPGIAGVSAQLYEAYANLNGGSLPESALIKATLLNTANDYGNIGPDFSFGWGLVNGLRAAMLIEEGRFLDATISQGSNNSHIINIPENTAQLRFMLYWADPAAASGASPALVNDLDLVVTDPNNNTFLPWVLDSNPNATTLNNPATTGVDHLNNMEQVLITNPISGDYNLNISGFNVPFGPQKYYIVYEIISDKLTLTYPNDGEKFVTGDTEVIHWDGYDLRGNTTLQYSTDNGVSWTSITTSIPASSTNYSWTVPNDISGQCLIRVSSGSRSDQSNDIFSIASRVSGVAITQVCPTEALVAWDNLQGAASYDVYLLGEKFMEVVGNTSSNSYNIPIIDPVNPIWVAVVAKGGNGWETLRSDAVNYEGGGLLNCSLSKDLTVSSINNSALDFQTICDTDPILISAQIENDGTDSQSNFLISYQIDSGAIIEETFTGTLESGTSETYTFTTPLSLLQNGISTLKVWTSLLGDEYVINDEKQLDFIASVTSTELDYQEVFESTTVLPETWALDNPDGASTWVSATNIIGSDGNTTKAIAVDGANYTSRGQEDAFTTEYFDLNFSGTPELFFDIAKAQWSSAYNDGFRVEVSVDCGSNFTQIYFKDGLDLATVPYVAATWSPSNAAEWRTESIDLTPYLGNDILLRFTNINDYSNTTIVDNVKVIKNQALSSSENSLLENVVSVYPNPSNSFVNVKIDNYVASKFELEMVNSLGQYIFTSTKKNFDNNLIKFDASRFNTGVYFLKIIVDESTIIRKLVIN